jgi:RNA polymerase sigma-70 factor (ECF subfamily)
MHKSPASSPIPDEELAQKVAAGSQSSFEELICRYSPKLLHFLWHKTGNKEDIEDLVQETFLKAYRNIERFDPELRFSTWLYTIASRLAISHFRSSSRRANKDTTVELISPDDPEERTIKKEESENIWLLAKTLHHKQYKALWLYYMEDMPTKEIAKIMKISPVQVRVLLHRARLNMSKKCSGSFYSKNLAGTTPAEHKFSFL